MRLAGSNRARMVLTCPFDGVFNEVDLAGDLGVVPSPRMERLYLAVLRHDDAVLGNDPGPAGRPVAGALARLTAVEPNGSPRVYGVWVP
jgi:hypothetical protein